MADWWQQAEDKLGVRLHRHSYAEVHGPCPDCGGSDRMIVWRHGKYWCRKCRKTGLWLGEEDAKRARAESLAERAQAERRAAWRLATQGDVWIYYHESCLADEHALALWKESGIEREDVERWGLGWTDECPAMKDHESLTIPVFRGGRLVDIQHRLIDPPLEGGKYRTEFVGIRPSVFNLDRVQGGRFVLVEGAKKVIVLEKHGIPAVGIPGANHGISSLVQRLHARGRQAGVVVGLDPGMGKQTKALSLEIAKTGARTWIADFPEKPDDFVISYGRDLAVAVIRQARLVGGGQNAKTNAGNSRHGRREG